MYRRVLFTEVCSLPFDVALGCPQKSPQFASPILDDSMNDTTFVQAPVGLGKTPLINGNSGQYDSVVVEGEKLGEKALRANQYNSSLHFAG
jgi:hypothetical protein